MSCSRTLTQLDLVYIFICNMDFIFYMGPNVLYRP